MSVITGYQASYELSNLDGSNGFVIRGENADDYTGFSVSSAGDINADGYDDIIIGSPRANDYQGKASVVFGSSDGFASAIALSSLDGSDGFTLNGFDGVEYSGFSVSYAGDFNGDGIDDIIIGTRLSGFSNDIYVVYGSYEHGAFGNGLELSSLDGDNGFILNISDGKDYFIAGSSVSSAGDVNGDGYDDLIIGVGGSSFGGGYYGPSYSGTSYVVFGDSDYGAFGADFNLSSLDGVNGFTLTGLDDISYDGPTVSGAGDINGDGYDDVIIGVYGYYEGASASYVVFGASGGFDITRDVSSLDGNDGFAIKGVDIHDSHLLAVSNAGDVNGDGYDDLIIGAWGADTNGNAKAGETYVVFGTSFGFGARLELSHLDGSDGFVIKGIYAGSYSGSSVSSAGDVNGDGCDDLIIGAVGADPNGEGSGQTYIVFGGSSIATWALNLSSLDGANGFKLNGIDAGDGSGASVSGAGDVNGDGYDDLIIGAPQRAHPFTNTNAGESYVIFGGPALLGQTPSIITFNNENTISVEENTTGVVLDIQAQLNNDVPDNGIYYDITGGADKHDFAINSLTGELSFISPPDYESNTDADNNAVYELTVSAFTDDGTANAAQTITITVTDVFEVPPVTAQASYELSSLNGSNGFVIKGIDGNSQHKVSVSNAGDVNGDGVDDIVIGSPLSGQNQAGESFVIFGSTGGFDSVIDLANLDGSNGFALKGIDLGDNSGHSVANAGDLNGDGLSDIIIGAHLADPNGTNMAGESYVVFGNGYSHAASVNLSSLDGSNGFALQGIDKTDQSGYSVSGAGDINGDGLDDLIIGAKYADPNGTKSGESYVVFGASAGFDSALELADLDGSDGFVINGVDAWDRSGISVSSAGDVNGDGYDDLIIGAYTAGQDAPGESYVVYGGGDHGFSPVLELSSLNGENGFAIIGVAPGDYSGVSVAGAGDINGDGFDDVIIGAYTASGGGDTYAGASYVVFGFNNDHFPAYEVNLSGLTGSNGFAIKGEDAYDYSGFSVSGAGDVNGDGYDDLIIGAYKADANGSRDAGTTYVVYGSNQDFSPELDLDTLDGINGYKLNGVNAGDRSGWSVSGAGDINDDGYDDLIIGAERAVYNDTSSSETYVFFGGPSPTPQTPAVITFNNDNTVTVEENTTAIILDIQARLDDDVPDSGIYYAITGGNDATSFMLNTETGELSFNTAPDYENPTDSGSDNVYELIITAYEDGGSASNTQSLTVTVTDQIEFTPITGYAASYELSSLDGSNGFVINGVNAGDYSGLAVSGAGDVNGDGFDDVIIGAAFADPMGFYSGQSYIVFGSSHEFDGALELSSLDGNNGFAINGNGDRDFSGISVSGLGDVNGDGIDDIIIGSTQLYDSSYVVFGSSNAFSATIGVTSLDGSNGFVLHGIDADLASGKFVAGAGDVNGDGIADIIVGSKNADPNGNSYAGESYVIFGKIEGFDAEINVSNLDGADGFKIQGINEDDWSGRSVASAGDVNGDGFDDLIIGAHRADPNGDESGQSYVIFGTYNFEYEISLSALDGSDGFTLNGIEELDRSGVSVAGAGDVNGDGFDDLLIGALRGDPNGTYNAGESYVVFGNSGNFGSVLELSSLDGANGFVINGIREDDISGYSLSAAGDINGDGFADIIIGARGADPNGEYSGETYVAFGNSGGFNSALNLSSLDGADGFKLNGIDADDQSSTSVSGAGDINGDGYDDLIIGALYGDPNGKSNAGESYVVFGGPALIQSSMNNSGNYITGTNNDDVITGGDGNDTIDGGAGSDFVNGGAGDDIINGGAGYDSLDGGTGDDTLTGGGDPDLFIFSANSDHDTITDFDANADMLDIGLAETGFTSFADVNNAASETILDDQSGVLIVLGSDQSVFIQGITLDALTSDNVFV